MTVFPLSQTRKSDRGTRGSDPFQIPDPRGRDSVPRRPCRCRLGIPWLMVVPVAPTCYAFLHCQPDREATASFMDGSKGRISWRFCFQGFPTSAGGILSLLRLIC